MKKWGEVLAVSEIVCNFATIFNEEKYLRIEGISSTHALQMPTKDNKRGVYLHK